MHHIVCAWSEHADCVNTHRYQCEMLMNDFMNTDIEIVMFGLEAQVLHKTLHACMPNHLPPQINQPPTQACASREGERGGRRGWGRGGEGG